MPILMADIIPFLENPKAITSVARRISHAFERNFELSELSLEVHSSIGIALFP